MSDNEKILSFKPCASIHNINGYVPTKDDLHLDGQVCDCRKIKFEKELCGCGDKTYELRPKENVS